MIGFSAFHTSVKRTDHDIALSMIPSGVRVLDVGCGRGELLSRIVKERCATARGLELSQAYVNDAVSNGLSVIQGDAEQELGDYPDKAFDYVVLSQAIQAMVQPRKVLHEILRIGKHAIVSFTNFEYWPVRLRMAFLGRMPVTEALPYRWYETPNIHFCSIADFLSLCEQDSIVVDKSVFLSAGGKPIFGSFFANIFADQAVLLLSTRIETSSDVTRDNSKK